MNNASSFKGTVLWTDLARMPGQAYFSHAEDNVLDSSHWLMRANEKFSQTAYHLRVRRCKIDEIGPMRQDLRQQQHSDIMVRSRNLEMPLLAFLVASFAFKVSIKLGTASL